MWVERVWNCFTQNYRIKHGNVFQLKYFGNPKRNQIIMYLKVESMIRVVKIASGAVKFMLETSNQEKFILTSLLDIFTTTS